MIKPNCSNISLFAYMNKKTSSIYLNHFVWNLFKDNVGIC